MTVYKFFINGPLGSGKTEAIKAVSDLPLISALKKVALTQNEIALDYGRVYVDSDMCYLYSAEQGWLSGQDWVGLCREMDGLIFIVDGSAANMDAGYSLFGELLASWKGPTVIGMNDIGRSDRADSTYAELAEKFGSLYSVFPFNARVRTSVLALVQAMVAAVLEGAIHE